MDCVDRECPNARLIYPLVACTKTKKLKLDDTCKMNGLYVGTKMHFWPCFILIILGYADSVSKGVAVVFGLLVKTSASACPAEARKNTLVSLRTTYILCIL